MNRKDSDIELDRELRKYMSSLLDDGKSHNPLVIDSVYNGFVRFVSWMRFPVQNNFMIFNTILLVSSEDSILQRNKYVKSLVVDKNIVSRLVFDYVSYCDKNGVVVKK